MQIVITPAGAGRCVYGEAIDLSVLGQLTIHAARMLSRRRMASGRRTSPLLRGLYWVHFLPQ